MSILKHSLPPSLPFLAGALLLILLHGGEVAAGDVIVVPGKKSLPQALAEAKPGLTVVLPPGTFTDGITVPAGVRLKGAGYGRTILDAGHRSIGVILKGKGCTLEDLTVRTQGGTAVLVEKCQDIAVRRVRILGGALGIRARDVQGGRIENCVVNGAMIGISLTHVQHVAVVNCTVANASSIGLTLIDAEDSAVFNNVVVDVGTGVLLGGSRRGLALDANLYRALVIGKVEGQQARISLGPWRDVSGGLDARSVNLPVTFADAVEGDLRPVSVLDWDPSRVTTSDWGLTELAGFPAPATDIDGGARVGAIDLGAFEAPPLKAAPPDGTFEVVTDEGTKSAGIYRPDGSLVRYLFQDLPLKKGKYDFQMPSRTQLGEPIAPGQYELRLVESRLGWTYRRITGNNGISADRSESDQAHTAIVRFAADGSLLLGNGWSERHESVRSRDLKSGKANWVFNGASDMHGLCVAADGSVYCLRASGKDSYLLSRLDGKTGKPMLWDKGISDTFNFPGAAIDGLAELDGVLYIADSKNGKVYHTEAVHPTFKEAFACAAPSLPSADRKRKLLWLRSGDRVVALSPQGKEVAECQPVPSPLGVAVAGDRLAVASAKTGKVHFFDCSKPAQLKPLKTIGRGDGPYGPLVPDRFHFQTGPYNAPRGVALDLDADGRLALRDASGRIVVLGPSGAPIYVSMAHFGNKPTPANWPDDDRLRVFEPGGRLSWWIDAKNNRWEPDALWGMPPNLGGGNPLVVLFASGGKRFAVLHQDWEDSGKKRHPGILIVRYDGYIARPALLYTPGKDGFVVMRDTNGDGVIDDRDGAGQPVLDSAGKPVRWNLTPRWVYATADGNGDLRSMGGVEGNGVGVIWKFKGLGADGHPVYAFGPDSVMRVKEPSLPSAYNFAKRENAAAQSESLLLPDGRFLATFQFGHSPNGMGLSNSGAIDVARYNSDGSLRWLRPLNDFGPVQGIKPMGKSAYLSSWGHQAEWFGLDENGLSLGHLGFPPEAQWTGMWVDHPDQYCTFAGNDGRWHVLCGDYMVNVTHWLTLQHYDDYRKASFPFTISPSAARALAFRPPVTYRPLGKPAAQRVLVRKLARPLPIDGDLKKWRDAGITPQVLITPVTATGSIDGPADCSAVVRLAYESNNLYVQVIRFDDVVTMHQPWRRSYLQDTVEIMLNGFADGFQFSVSNYTDIGPGIVRRRFFAGSLEALVPAAHAPRTIKVLDNAKDVSERELIEAAYGVDLSKCKVIVTEFKLPIDRETYRGSEDAIFPVRSGATFWLGFMICDNDVPGADIQDFLVWPASFGTFQPKEDGALAVFE
jgi:hypothetical protein